MLILYIITFIFYLFTCLKLSITETFLSTIFSKKDYVELIISEITNLKFIPYFLSAFGFKRVLSIIYAKELDFFLTLLPPLVIF
jgi:hypothetical protein